MDKELRLVTTSLREIKRHRPCRSGMAKLKKHLGPKWSLDGRIPVLTILESNGLNDLHWAINNCKGLWWLLDAYHALRMSQPWRNTDAQHRLRLHRFRGAKFDQWQTITPEFQAHTRASEDKRSAARERLMRSALQRAIAKERKNRA